MQEITEQLESGDFKLDKKSYRELKKDYLAFVITVVEIANGAAYLFNKSSPNNQRNWKAALELEQYRHVLEQDQEN